MLTLRINESLRQEIKDIVNDINRESQTNYTISDITRISIMEFANTYKIKKNGVLSLQIPTDYL